jgi:EmrB/QacA subfamily drug resistance transporter
MRGARPGERASDRSAGALLSRAPSVPRPRRSDEALPATSGASPAPAGSRARTAARERAGQPPGAPSTEHGTAAPAPSPTGGWGLPLLVVIIGMFMSILDTSIVNVAIPTIQKQFGTTPDNIQWITTAYTLSLGVIVPTSAWLGERLGLKRLYLISLIGFALFSALCGMAWDLGSMIAFRILQAVPGGVIPVTCLTLLYRMVPKKKLGTAMGLYGLGIVVAPGVGPTLGGYLVEYVDWRLIFYINVPVGILGALAAMVVLPGMPGQRSRRFDLPGFVCIAGGLFALLLALSEGQDWGWTGYRVLILLAASANLLALFVVIELNTEEPLLEVRAFTCWPFVNSLLLISILSIGLFAVLFYVPLYLQEGQDITPMHTGLTVLPQASVLVVMMPLAGRLYDRIGPRWPAVVGLAVCGVGTLLLTRLNVDLPRGQLAVWLMIRAAGLGLAMMPIMTGGIAALPARIVNAGSAFNTLTQRVTAALGLAALTALATRWQEQLMSDRSALLDAHGADANPRILAMQHAGRGGLIPLWQQLRAHVQAQAYSDVFLVAGVTTLIGVALALLLRSGRPSDSESAEQRDRPGEIA